MNEAPPPSSPVGFTGKLIHRPLQTPGRALPLAQARNLGARIAQGEQLVFLDVDCIPARELLADYAAGLKGCQAAIAMGEVYYLPAPLPALWRKEDLVEQGASHPARRYLRNELALQTQDYHLFWSLNFAVSKQTFWDIGGFDENFHGYGAEDTDFAFGAQAAGVPLLWVKGAAVFHQYHGSYSPPLQHFSDIIQNARVFYQKWRRWPMEKWLQQFADAGYIRWSVHSSALDCLSVPTHEAVQAARCG